MRKRPRIASLIVSGVFLLASSTVLAAPTEVEGLMDQAGNLLTRANQERTPQRQEELRRQALEVYKQAVEKVGAATEPRILWYRAGSLALVLKEWGLARDWCGRYRGIVGNSDSFWNSAERCRADAERQILGTPIQMVAPGPNVGSPASTAPPQPNSQVAPSVAPPPSPDRTPQGAAPGPAPQEPLPSLALAAVAHCQQLAQRDRAMGQGCYERLLESGFAGSTAAVRSLAMNLAGSSAPATTAAPHRGALVGTGLTLWLSALTPAATFANLYAEGGSYNPLLDPRQHPQEVFYTLAIPVAGPFISGIWFATRPNVTQDAWLQYTLPWILVDGIAQVTGFSLFVAGLSKRSSAAPGSGSLQSWRLLPSVSLGQATLTFQGAY